MDINDLKCCGNCLYSENGCAENADYNDNKPVDCSCISGGEISHNFNYVCQSWEWDKQRYKDRI